MREGKKSVFPLKKETKPNIFYKGSRVAIVDLEGWVEDSGIDSIGLFLKIP